MEIDHKVYRIKLKHTFGISRSENEWYDVLFIYIKDILCSLGLIKHSIGEVILFKNKPELKTLHYMRKYKWEYKILPKNPYL